MAWTMASSRPAPPSPRERAQAARTTSPARGKDESPGRSWRLAPGFPAPAGQARSMRGTALLSSAAGWLGRRPAVLLLAVTAAGLAAGGVARLTGATGVADAC